jgi:signal transduction histidine kinase
LFIYINFIVLEKETIILAVIVATCILFVFIVFIYFSIVFYRKKHILQEQEKELIKSNFQQTLLQTQIEIQEQTLTNISQELHDNIGQSLSLAKLNLNTIKLDNTEKAQQNIDSSKDIITSALVNLRDLAKSMLGEKITEVGLQLAVQNELKILENTGKYEIEFSSDNETTLLTPQQELIAFRIIQETIHNMVKHAEATKISIAFVQNSSELKILISDNGVGFKLADLDAAFSGVGFKNMKNRAKLINATFELSSEPMKGTITTLIFKQ